MTQNRLERVRQLRQSGVPWLCTARRAPFWIMPKDRPPYRPFVVLVLVQDTGLIRHTHVQGERPTPESVLEVLVKAMYSPLLGALLSPLLGFGSRGRPAHIVLDDADLVQALAPHLAELDIRCSYRATLPPVNAALREMEARMTKREPIPGLLSVPGATVPLVAELFTAAAEYYRQAPWRWMDNWLPIEVRYPPAGRARYALVLGSGGETFGLSLYESPGDVYAVLSNAAPGRQELISSFSLVLEEATAMSFEDLDAMEKYGWPVAGERAYPLAMKSTPDGSYSEIPNASELAWLAATLRVIPDFVVRHLRADRGRPRRARATYSLPGVHGGQALALRYAVEYR
jgi:hypothetical protein